MRKKVVVNSKRSPAADIWYRFCKNRTAMIGLIIITIIILLAVFADVICNYDLQAIKQFPLERLQPPSTQHIFGTDAFGRDLFARIIFGARYSLSFGIICTSLALFLGGLIGAASAFFGGIVDNIIMRVFDALMCIPGLLFMLAIISAFGPGLNNMMLAIVISSIPGYARMVRVIVLGIVRQDYIEASKAVGVRNFRIISWHVLPNAVGPIIVNAMMSIAGLIMSAAALSFIGMGIQPPAPEWGAMLSESMTYLRLYPHIVLFPGLAILLTALSFNLMGDGLADALDPRMKD